MSGAAKRHPRLTSGLWFATIRLILGGLLMLQAHSSPEANLIVSGDLPTLGAYGLLQSLGVEWPIVGAADIKFLLTSLVVWFLVGVIFAAVYLRVKQGRQARIDPQSGSG